MRRLLLLVFLGIGLTAWTVEVPLEKRLPNEKQEPERQEPWLTGPLITPSARNIPRGELNFEPYLFATASSSAYDSNWERVAAPPSNWNLSILAILQAGITNWLDFTIIPSWAFLLANGSHSFVLQDFYAAFGFQLLKQSENGWYPSIRLVLGETFPIGRFDNLDPEQFGTDAAGAGAYLTRITLLLSEKIQLHGFNWLSLRFGASWTIPSNVRVRGVSAYGGAFDTNGSINPGQGYQLLFGCELSLTQQWALAYDLVANYNQPIQFTGFPGFNELTGLPANLNQPFSTQYSMAPAIEYSWSAKLGVISGVWFTMAGKNATAFTSWVTALNYFY